jgi:hypothetical protein
VHGAVLPATTPEIQIEDGTLHDRRIVLQLSDPRIAPSAQETADDVAIVIDIGCLVRAANDTPALLEFVQGRKLFKTDSVSTSHAVKPARLLGDDRSDTTRVKLISAS